jgi:hypothetical protein
MPNLNISQLPQQTTVVANNLLPLWDSSYTGAERTRHVTIATLSAEQQRLNGIKIKTLSNPQSLAIVPYSHPATNGDFSIAIGDKAAISLTTGGYNAAIGFEAGKSSTTGSAWTAIGALAGTNNTIGNGWSAIGTYAGTASTTGNSWFAAGYVAGASNTIGDNWTAIGFNASSANVTGSNWTAVGLFAAGGNVAGSAYCAVGFYAGYYNTGTGWTAIGTGAGINTPGDYSTTVGYYAGQGLGSYSVAIGYFAGYYETGSNVLAIDSGFYVNPLIAGNFSSRNVGFNSKNYCNGAGVISLPEATTVPTTLPVSGACLYVASGVARIRTTAGECAISQYRGTTTVTTPSVTDTITVAGASVGDCCLVSGGGNPMVTAANTVTFDSSTLAVGTVVNAIVFPW